MRIIAAATLSFLFTLPVFIKYFNKNFSKQIATGYKFINMRNSAAPYEKKLKKAISKLPPMILCDKCKALGYCRASTEEEDYSESKRLYSIKDFESMIPIRAVSSNALHYNNYAMDTLQKAFDAFHQNDYETAILLFRMIINDNAELHEANLYVAISYLFAEDYENASRFIIYNSDNRYGMDRDMISGFLDLCIEKITDQLFKNKFLEINAPSRQYVLQS